MKMKNLRFFVLLFLLFTFSFIQAQDTINECPPEGKTKVKRLKTLNIKKNRYELPKSSDIDANITMEALMEKGNDEERFDENKAAVIEGYIFDVTNTGEETCNCNATEEKYQDVHIVIVEKKSYTKSKYHVIVEITPRLRNKVFEKLGVENNKELRKKLIGMKVKVTGWLLFDEEHRLESFNIDPKDNKGRKNWRATCWEIHPITNIEVVD